MTTILFFSVGWQIVYFGNVNVFNLVSPAKIPNLAELCNPITRQTIELESYPNHPRIQQVS